MKKKHVILVIYLIILFCGFVALLVIHRSPSPTLDSRVVASLTYANKTDETQAIYYHFIKTKHNTATVSAGLNTDVFRPLFDPGDAEVTTEMMIRDWYGCLYKLPSKSYLCWSVSQEASYALEYDPNVIDDESIIKMANSAVLLEPIE